MESSLHGKFYTCKISCQQLQTESRCISACAGRPLIMYTNPPNHQNFCTDRPQCSHILKTMVSWCTGYVLFSASFFLYMYIHIIVTQRWEKELQLHAANIYHFQAFSHTYKKGGLLVLEDREGEGSGVWIHAIVGVQTVYKVENVPLTVQDQDTSKIKLIFSKPLNSGSPLQSMWYTPTSKLELPLATDSLGPWIPH